MKIFNDSFDSVDLEEIVRAVKVDGFFQMQNAFSDEWVSRLCADVGEHHFSVNENWVTGVYAENQYYLTHMLACSKTFFDYATNPKIFRICDRVLGETYRLKAMRYYETYGRHDMQWHTDNKTDRGFAHIPGLIFIVYLVDVADGEFQFIRGSHNWSGEKAYSDYTDSLIEHNHREQVVSFKAPKGTLLIYDTYGIHRAKPVADRKFVRKSLFMQIDNKLDSAEPILINPSFFHANGVESKLSTFLGFGRPSEYEVFPVTSLKTLQFKRLHASTMAQWGVYRMMRTLYEAAPKSLKNVVRRMSGRAAR